MQRKEDKLCLCSVWCCISASNPSVQFPNPSKANTHTCSESSQNVIALTGDIGPKTCASRSSCWLLRVSLFRHRIAPQQITKLQETGLEKISFVYPYSLPLLQAIPICQHLENALSSPTNLCNSFVIASHQWFCSKLRSCDLCIAFFCPFVPTT